MWVHRILVDTLEKTFGMKTHIHQKDFPIGKYIADNIANAIEKSCKVMAVISSKLYIQTLVYGRGARGACGRCRQIYHSAVQRHSCEGSVCNTGVKYLLEKKTYCEWAENRQAEKLFWKKLVQTFHN